MNAIANMARLTKAGAVIAWSGARVLPDEARLPPPLRLFGRVMTSDELLREMEEAMVATASEPARRDPPR